jgi:penicillin-binding protein 1C
MKRLRRVLLGLLAFGFVVEVAILITPLPKDLTDGIQPSTEFLDREGRPLRLMLAEEERFSRSVALDEVSSALVDATLSAEDKRFRHHPGIDPLATARALSQMVASGEVSSGASTISQQLIKLASPRPRTLSSKFREIWIALKLEQSWSKDRILTEYLNRLEYGNLRTGIASASRFYFGKPPSDLSASEAAFLAGLPKAPGRLNPHSNLEGARARQQWVLGRMHEDGRLDDDALTRALAEPLRLMPASRQFEAPHFVDLLLKRPGLIPPDGGPVKTTLDLELNRFVETALTRNLAEIADRRAGGGAVVVIDNPTGDVLALAGSGDYFEAGAGQVNGAWIIRSPGSAVKPFTYLLALENGCEPSTVIADVPSDFATPTGLYHPNNYNHRFHGPVSLRFALANSLNVGAIRTLQLGGGPEALHRMLQRHDITTLGHPAEYYGLGLTLGNGELRLLELANAYAGLARLGVHRPYRLLLREPGQTETGTRLASEAAAWQLADMLADNAARAPAFGWNSYLNFDFPVACKTGTSSDYRDNWTVAYTPEFTVAVWVGNPDGSTMQNITGVTGAAPIMHEVFEHLHRRFGTSWFKRPEGLKQFPVDPLTGRLVEVTRPGAVMEWHRQPPEPARPSDYDAEGRVRLGAEYQPWLAGPQNTLGALAVAATSTPDLRILEPKPGSVYFLDADIPSESQWIPLRAEASGTVRWSCDTEASIEESRFMLREGRHQLTAVDESTGTHSSTWIEVRRW